MSAGPGDRAYRGYDLVDRRPRPFGDRKQGQVEVLEHALRPGNVNSSRRDLGVPGGELDRCSCEAEACGTADLLYVADGAQKGAVGLAVGVSRCSHCPGCKDPAAEHRRIHDAEAAVVRVLDQGVRRAVDECVAIVVRTTLNRSVST